MAKNDYRRSLIMLRGLEKGYSGHARLEKRVTSGTMDFVVSAPVAEETLSCAFVGARGKGKTAAKAIGLLKTDGRGQRALLATFDPRNIAGLDLSEVSAVIIARLEENGVQPLMYGYINGARQLDWQSIETALNALYGAGEAEEGTKAEESAPLPQAEAPAEPETAFEAERTAAEAEETQEKSAASQEEGQPRRVTAGALLNIDMSQPWPENIESLRILFLTLPAYEPFEKEGFVFVKAAMAAETNIDHCAVGVRAQDGKIAQVCYAIPMPYSPQPPAGLEGYEWLGNTVSGWWLTVDDV